MSSRLSKPNIFILQNRWDISVGEDDPEEVEQVQIHGVYQFCLQFQNIYVPVVCKICFVFFLLIFKVKEQHYQRNVEFLADQLKVVDRQEAKNRIFFVSAKETLISRLHEDNKTPTPRKFHYQLN